MFRNRPKKARPMDLDLGAEAAISLSRFCPTLKLLPMHSLYKVLCDNSSVFRSPPRRWIYPCSRVKRDRFLTGWACDEGSFRWRNTSFYARLASYMWVMKGVTKAHAPRLPCLALIICIPLSQASAADNAKVITSDGSRMQLELSQTHTVTASSAPADWKAAEGVALRGNEIGRRQTLADFCWIWWLISCQASKCCFGQHCAFYCSHAQQCMNKSNLKPHFINKIRKEYPRQRWIAGSGKSVNNKYNKDE